MPHDKTHLTIGELAALLGRPQWEIRKVVDALGPVPRAGLYRLVPRDLLPKIKAALDARKESACA